MMAVKNFEDKVSSDESLRKTDAGPRCDSASGIILNGKMRERKKEKERNKGKRKREDTQHSVRIRGGTHRPAWCTRVTM